MRSRFGEYPEWYDQDEPERPEDQEPDGHTPGPWVTDGRHVSAPEENFGPDADGGSSVCSLPDMNYRSKAADACLIAAAPELLAALRLLAKGSDEGRTPIPHGPEWSALCAAIAKAEGRS